jgi:hypothetical protein
VGYLNLQYHVIARQEAIYLFDKITLSSPSFRVNCGNLGAEYKSGDCHVKSNSLWSLQIKPRPIIWIYIKKNAMQRNSITLAFLFCFLSLSLSGMAQDVSAILKESNARFSMIQDYS